MPKVSVIIPIYKVENYIERCAISLMEQTLNDIEYIFVDDCSPDRSVEILKNVIERYPDRKDSVKIVRMAQNSRQAAVREYGMRIATGDYIIHCDSDDWVDVDLYEKMYSEAISKDADAVFCPRVDEYANSSVLRRADILPATGKELVSKWYCSNIGMHTWSKLVRRSIFIDNDLYPYEGINLWEDNGLMLRFLYYADRISSINGSAYHYNQANQNAITASYGRREIDQMLNCAIQLNQFFAAKPDADEFRRTVNSIKYLAKINLITTRYDWLKEFNMLFPESNEAKKYISLNAFSLKGKIRFLFVRYHMAWLFVSLYKLIMVMRGK